MNLDSQANPFSFVRKESMRKKPAESHVSLLSSVPSSWNVKEVQSAGIINRRKLTAVRDLILTNHMITWFQKETPFWAPCGMLTHKPSLFSSKLKELGLHFPLSSLIVSFGICLHTLILRKICVWVLKN